MRLVILILIFLKSNFIYAQSSEIHIGILEFTALKKSQKLIGFNNPNKYNNLKQNVEIYIIERLIQDKRFVIVERSKLNLISKELELQKSENFMDGYVVTQGKQIGAEYLMSGILNPDSKELILSFYSVINNEVIYKKAIQLKSDFWSDKDIKNDIQAEVSEMIDQLFPIEIPLVEVLEFSSDKVPKVVLVGGGSKNGFINNEYVNLYINESKVVQNKTMDREITIATGKILEVENENFSRIKIQNGNKELGNQLNNRSTILCKLKK